MLRATLGILFVLVAVVCEANENRPAYLELKQTSPDNFDLLWKVPARAENQGLAIHVVLGEDIEYTDPIRSEFVGAAIIERTTVSRPGGLAGSLITISGLEAVQTDVLVRIEMLTGGVEVVRLTPGVTSFIVSESVETFEIAKTYLLFGIEHILQGWDHLLFIACLLLIARSWRRVLITITGFTVAHSITLTLAALELVRLAIAPIEATIALSIVFLAREIIRDQRDTLTWRHPILVSSSFGLLHGFGFAAALADIGLPQTEIPAALLSFNVGVEIGQILFVCLLFTLAWVANKILKDLKKAELIAAYGVGGITMLWTLERILSF